MAELPHVAKLYEMMAERKDTQLVTFNVDENPGVVQSFLKEHQYKFPVLLAHSFTNANMDRLGTPQNWVVNRQGKWISTLTGFSSENNWEISVIRRLEEVHNSGGTSGTPAPQK
jgi:hypothetical protein